jgi:hypothetical protein
MELPMKRAAVLSCAMIEEPRFKVFRQRGQLPFDPPEGDGYTLDHAFRLRLMLDLIGVDATEEQDRGMAPGYAAEVVREVMKRFPRHPLNQIEPFDWWAGLVVFERKTFDGIVRNAVIFAGELQNLSAWVEDQQAERWVGPGTGGRKPAVRLLLVNVTRAANFVNDRAEEIGLPIGVTE